MKAFQNTSVSQEGPSNTRFDLFFIFLNSYLLSWTQKESERLMVRIVWVPLSCDVLAPARRPAFCHAEPRLTQGNVLLLPWLIHLQSDSQREFPPQEAIVLLSTACVDFYVIFSLSGPLSLATDWLVAVSIIDGGWDRKASWGITMIVLIGSRSQCQTFSVALHICDLWVSPSIVGSVTGSPPPWWW